MSHQIKQFYEFGDFRFDPSKRVLWLNGKVVPLAPKATEVLLLLIERRGDLIERDELLEKVWQDTFVEEGNLNNAISALRKNLGANGIIQTVPRRGYRFTADVRDVAYEDQQAALIIEKNTLSETWIEEHEEIQNESSQRTSIFPKSNNWYLILGLVSLLFITIAFSVWYSQGNSENSLPIAKESKKVLAILPLQSLNGEKEDTFAVGITESLISRLGRLKKIVVRPTNSIKQLTKKEFDPLEIGRQTKADVVLTGNFLQTNGRIRVTFRLLNVSDGSQIWTGSFDETETDIFKLQDSLSSKVAESLVESLSPKEQQQLALRSTDDFEAYKLYLRGRHAWNKRTVEGLRQSIRFYQDAIDRDPTFALAYAGLADSYVIFNDYDVALPSECYPKAKAAAYKALQINPDLIEPRTALAYVLATYDWDWKGAEREYRRVIEINPDYPTAHQWYGEFLYALKRFQEAEIELKHAAELDPLVPIIQSELGAVLYYSGKYDESIAQYSKIKQDFPNFPTSYLFSAWSYEQKKMPDAAFQEEIVFWRLQGFAPSVISDLENAYHQAGRTAFLQQIANFLESDARGGEYVHEYRLVHLYARLLNREKTLEWLEKGVENHSSNIIKIYLDRNFDFLRDDERFQMALRKMNFPG